MIDYSQTIDDVHENLEHYNPPKKRRVLIVFEDMIGDTESNKKLVTESFLRERKLNIDLFLYENLISKSLKLWD